MNNNFMAELISKAHKYGSDFDLDKIYILKDKFEEAITQIIPENEFGISRISFTRNCIEVEYATVIKEKLKLKTLVIDKNSVI